MFDLHGVTWNIHRAKDLHELPLSLGIQVEPNSVCRPLDRFHCDQAQGRGVATNHLDRYIVNHAWRITPEHLSVVPKLSYVVSQIRPHLLDSGTRLPFPVPKRHRGSAWPRFCSCLMDFHC